MQSPFRRGFSSKPAQKNEPHAIIFKTRANASSGGRRLFVPQKPLLSPVFQPDPQRRRGLLRVLSNYA